MPELNPYQQGVVDRLRSAANIFEERAAVYKDNYKAVGRVMEALFPDGHAQHTQDDHNRWHLFELVIVKLTRYVNNYDGYGHQDSLDDMIVYLSMLGGLDELNRIAELGEEPVLVDEADAREWENFDAAMAGDEMPTEMPGKIVPTNEGGAVHDQELADLAGVKLITRRRSGPNREVVESANFGTVVFSVGDSVRFKQHRGRGQNTDIIELDPSRNDGLTVCLKIGQGSNVSKSWVHPAWLEIAHKAVAVEDDSLLDNEEDDDEDDLGELLD